jgi:tetratricopeptide (TPR) repeat protein
MTDLDPSPRTRVFISYSHDSRDHKINLLALSQLLRRKGLDVMIDQYIDSSPPLSWAQWMQEEVEQADFVLLVFTETYAKRFLGKEEPGRGLGVRWEGALITSGLYHAEEDRAKFVPVVINAADARYIPAPLKLTTWYEVGTPDKREVDRLLRHLLRQPAVSPEPLGPIAVLNSVGQDVPGGTDKDERSAIEGAMDLARSGDTEGAKRILQSLLDDASRSVRALAAYNLGRLWHEEEIYSQAITAYQRSLEFEPDSELAAAAGTNLQRVQDQMSAHYGEGGPVAAAQSWLRLIRDGDIRGAWQDVEGDTRLAPIPFN